MTITSLLSSCERPWDGPARASARCRLRHPDGSWGDWGPWGDTSSTLADPVPDGRPRPKAQAALDAWLNERNGHPDIEWQGRLDPIPHQPTTPSPSGP